jgi:hypothetical protein
MCEVLDFRSLEVSTGENQTIESSRNLENQLSSDAEPCPREMRTSKFDLFLPLSWPRPSENAI